MLTQEQQSVVDNILSSDTRIIAVNSIAGSGKTATAEACIKAVKPKNGFYTAFNKAIVTDASNRFSKFIECKTVHSLAYKYIKPKQIEELNYNTIKEDIPYEDKAEIIRILDDFFRSISVDVYDYVSSVTDNDIIRSLVCTYAERMLEGKIYPNFNFLLKCLHIMLANGSISIDKDLLVLDECQDTTAVTLEIFKLINCNKKIIFGDKFQNIYSFMNTINAFEELDNLNEIRLTKSFRCSPYIARQVEIFGEQYLEDGFKYTGTDTVKPKDYSEIGYISRNNSTLIERMASLIDEGKTFKLIRPVQTIFELPLNMMTAYKGDKVLSPKYLYLNTEYKKYMANSRYNDFFEYLEFEAKVPDVRSIANTLKNFKAKRINIFKLYKTVKDMIPNNHIILSTAHAFKGLEADKVILEDDLNRSINTIINNIKSDDVMYNIDNPTLLRKMLTKEDRENLNTYYVALSRARTSIHNVNYRM